LIIIIVIVQNSIGGGILPETPTIVI
jgi:hypothetical protein